MVANMIRKIIATSVVILIFVPAQMALGSIINNIYGNIDLSFSQNKTDQADRESLRQQYTIYWQKSFVNKLSIRTSYLYSKYDISSLSRSELWQEEKQPITEIIWNSAGFTIGSEGRYQDTKSNNTAINLIRESWSMYFKSKKTNIPLFSLRYYWDHSYNEMIEFGRNTYERRFQAEVNHNFKINTMVNYNFTYRVNKNQVTPIKSSQFYNTFHISDTRNVLERKLRITTDYTFNYRSSKDERPASGYDLVLLPVNAGLFAHTTNFFQDTLYTYNSLIDGNTETSPQITINIGGTSINQNIGADLGFERDVSAIYLYTDRVGNNQQSWEVYSSDDNYNWMIVAVNPSIIFNEGFNRLEIVFPTIKTRFIKVVNSGFSDIENVLVTEIQVYAEEAVSEITSQSTKSHLLDVSLGYKVNAKVNTNLNISYQNLPGAFTGSHRNNLYYSLSTRYEASSLVTHNFQWQQGMQFYDDNTQDVNNRTISYAMLLSPLKTLEFSMSLYSYQNYYDAVKNSDSKNILLHSRGKPLPGLNMAAEVGFGRYTYYFSDLEYDSWYYQFSFDGAMTRSLNLIFSYSNRISDIKTSLERKYLSQYQAGMTYRVTRSMFFRSDIGLMKNGYEYFTQDYLLSWSWSTRINVNVQAGFQDDRRTFKTKKYNYMLNYKLTAGSNLFASYSINDYSQAGGEKTSSIRAGFRTGF